MSQKISSLKNFARVAANKENNRGLQELLEKAVLTWQKLPIVVFATSVYIHVNNQQPRVSHTIVNDSCLFWQCLCTPVRCINTVVWI